jgi:hypothetical protein
MAIEQKNTTSSSIVAACMRCLLRNDAQAVKPVYCGGRVCAAW